MEKLPIVILGNAGSGKTTRVRDLTKGKKTVWANPNGLKHLLKLIRTDTEFIVIDELDINKIKALRSLVHQEVVVIKHMHSVKPETINIPQLVLIVQCSEEVTEKDIFNILRINKL